MALKIVSIDGKQDVVVTSAEYVQATGIVGLETSGNIEKIIQGDKVILSGKDSGYQPISADEWNSCYETVSANSATWMTETDWTDDINAASAYALAEAKTWVENQNYITGVDLSNYYQKTETSGASEISAALDLKEDKIRYSYDKNRAISAINGSAVALGNSNITSGHDAMVLGEGLIANASQVVVGRFNETVDGTNGISAAGIDNTSGAVFVVGNGIHKADSYDVTATKRSNAMIVSADGTVSATRFATSGIADLEAKILELENIIATFSARWVLTNQPEQNNG